MKKEMRRRQGRITPWGGQLRISTSISPPVITSLMLGNIFPGPLGIVFSLRALCLASAANPVTSQGLTGYRTCPRVSEQAPVNSLAWLDKRAVSS